MKAESIYLAARYHRRGEMVEVADRFQADGHKIVSSWVYGGEEGKTREEIAVLDYNDIKRCSLLVLFTYERGTLVSGGGRHVEFGLAYAHGKTCFTIGPKEHVFCDLPGVKQFDTVYEALEHLRNNI